LLVAYLITASYEKVEESRGSDGQQHKTPLINEGKERAAGNLGCRSHEGQHKLVEELNPHEV